ncbi:serine hydrolase [Litoribacter populi]|uniref:serine hydrolase n=1 Tax=Litoribacter populi TaxID=2598460 RepID=UPI00118152C4|nr:serine hydrolase [Litoribacter populi]
MIKFTFLSACILIANLYALSAQTKEISSLYRELEHLDSLFFQKSFNQCDFDYLEGIIAHDLRFYHDQSGFQDRDSFFQNIRKNICANQSTKPIRKLERGSLKVYPLYDDGELYGAIQQGVHHFFLREVGNPDRYTSTANFTHVWRLQEGEWKLSEVLSYDHQLKDSDSSKVKSMEELLKRSRVPALGLGIIQKGRLTSAKVYGTLDKERMAPHNAIFKVASLTKPVVAMTVLKLIDSGLLELDEPLSSYWVDEDVREDDRHRSLTARLVLTHQTGLPNWRYMEDANRLAFKFEPGAGYQYSGEGFEWLRKAVEKKLGRSLEELAKQYLFMPAGMEDTRFWWDSGMDELRYAQNFDKEGNPFPTEKYFQANAAANLLTTVEDYGRFLTYVLDGAGLSKDLLNEMHRGQVQPGDDQFFGLGWEKHTGFSGGEYALMHTGRDPGVNTLAIIFPHSKNGYLILLNGDNASPVFEELLRKELYLGQELWDKR